MSREGRVELEGVGGERAELGGGPQQDWVLTLSAQPLRQRRRHPLLVPIQQPRPRYGRSRGDGRVYRLPRQGIEQVVQLISRRRRGDRAALSPTSDPVALALEGVG